MELSVNTHLRSHQNTLFMCSTEWAFGCATVRSYTCTTVDTLTIRFSPEHAPNPVSVGCERKSKGLFIYRVDIMGRVNEPFRFLFGIELKSKQQHVFKLINMIHLQLSLKSMPIFITAHIHHTKWICMLNSIYCNSFGNCLVFYLSVLQNWNHTL